MATNIKINMKVLKAQIEPAMERRTIDLARGIAREIFEEKKDKFLDTIEADPVSQELLAENSIFQSEYIQGGGEHGGNLYSFFGFEIGDENPVSRLLEYLRNNINISTKTKLRNGIYKFQIIAPTQSQIDSVTKMAWINRSWIKAVENGLSNIKHYIRILDGSEFSRSEEGLQIKNTMNKSFRPKRYFFTQRYTDFLKKIGR